MGQNVLLNLKNFTMPQKLTPKFMSKFVDPFSIMGHVFKDIHKLVLLPKFKMHPIFHISLLNPLKKNTLWLNLVGDHLEYKVEGMFKYKKPKQKKNIYLVRWQRYRQYKTTWVATRDMVIAKVLWSAL